MNNNQESELINLLLNQSLNLMGAEMLFDLI